MSETITYGGVVFLRHKESYEVRKGKVDTIMYYTRQDTGESGMSVQGLANACGIAQQSLVEALKTFSFEGTGKKGKIDSNDLTHNKKEGTGKPDDFYLIETDDAHVVRDMYCERVIYFYAFESRYKKTKARELYQSLAQHGLRSFIHAKTGYRPEQAQHHDDSLTRSIEEQLKREVEELKLKLVEQQTQLVEQQGQLAEQAKEIHNLKYRPVNEKTYQAYLQGVMGGSRELYLSGPYPGRVDIVTNRMVVEVKRIENFETAFGQLLRYRAKLRGSEHEGKAYVIYLFGAVTQDERRVLDAMAEMTNFQLMIEQELQDYLDEDELTTRDKIRVVVSN